MLTFVALREGPDETHTFGQDSIFELALGSDEPTEILRLPNGVLGYAWDPAGLTLAYQVRAEGDGELLPVVLCLFDSGTGGTFLLKTLGVPFGTGIGQREEASIAWSPGGERILVVETLEEPSVSVVGRDGRDVVPPWSGRFARWLTEETVLSQQATTNDEEPSDWFTVSLLSGQPIPISLPPNAYRPAVSPDGGAIVFDNGNGRSPSVFVWSIQEAEARKVASGYLAPVWLSNNLVGASAAGRCPPSDFCNFEWKLTGGTVGIDILRDREKPLTLPTTLQKVIRYGAIDVVSPSTP